MLMCVKKLLSFLLGLNFLAGTPVLGQPSSPPPTQAASNTRPGAPPMQNLTAEQLAKIKTVLASYKPTSLTTDDAKNIKRTLRDTGIRPGPALDKALSEAGFSAEKLDALAPPPPRPAGEGNAPPPPPPKK